MVKIRNEVSRAFQRTNNPKMAERDYLECVVLDKLFQDDYIKSSMVFAGGGTLTKAYSISDRIGQDIDLACADFQDIPDTRSKKQLANFKRNFKEFVFDDIRPRFETILGQGAGFKIMTDRDWNSLRNEHQFMSSPTLHLMHPSAFTTDFLHICVEIIPRKYNPNITSVQTLVPYSLGGSSFGEIPTVAYEQTFWDKVFALHSNALARVPHFDEGFSRHYYDVATLSPFVDLSGSAHMLRDISAHQQKYTTKDLGIIQSPSSVQLLPDDSTLCKLADDYYAMSGAFSKMPETWTRIVQMLNELNQRFKTL